MSNSSTNLKNNENSQNSQLDSKFYHNNSNNSDNFQHNLDHSRVLESDFGAENLVVGQANLEEKLQTQKIENLENGQNLEDLDKNLMGSFEQKEESKNLNSQNSQEYLDKKQFANLTNQNTRQNELKNESKSELENKLNFSSSINQKTNQKQQEPKTSSNPQNQITAQENKKTQEDYQDSNKKSIISVIIPCFNEQENIADCYNELIKVWTKLPLYDLEVIFVDDGSSDWTVLEITKIQITDPRVKLIEFSRNFGKEIAISAGFDHCSGESAIVVDADLQYPLDKIPEFVTLWESGSEVVIGMRDKKQTSNIIEKIGSRSFYWIMDKIGEREILPGALDFRLIDREVIDHFNRFTERNRMARALVDWLGFDRSFVNYQEKPRNKGSASYSLGKRIKLALNSFILHSLFPLKIAGYLGIFITFFAGFLGLSALVNQFLWNKGNFNFSGSFLLGLLNLFLIGIVLICLGLNALYIANIHTEVVNRPLYIVKTRRAKTQNRLSIIVKD